MLVGLDDDRPLTGPPPASPLRLAALTLGGVTADAADVSGMAGRGHWAPMTVCTGGWCTCCGDTTEWGLRLAVGRRDGEFWVRRGDTVAVGRSWAWADECAAGEWGWRESGVTRLVCHCNAIATDSFLGLLLPGLTDSLRSFHTQPPPQGERLRPGDLETHPISPKPCHSTKQPALRGRENVFSKVATSVGMFQVYHEAF